MSTTEAGVAENTPNSGALDLDGAAAAFLDKFKDAEGPSDTGKGDDEDGEPKKKKVAPESKSADKAADDEASEETPDDDAEGDKSEDAKEEDDKAKRKYAEDDDTTYIKVKVGDDEHEVPVKDLKRLFGQEAALTRKSQEVADKRTEVEAGIKRHATALETLLTRATERAAPYKQIDLLVASKTLTAEELTYLRKEMDAAINDEKFLKDELDGVVKDLGVKAQAARATQAAAAVKELTDPEGKNFIKGWNEKTYNDIRAFSITEGLDKDVVNNLVDAPSFKLLHMAMLYKRGAAKVVATAKVNKTPAKIVKSSNTRVAQSNTGGKTDKAMAQLKTKGNVENAANAFMARWEDASDD